MLRSVDLNCEPPCLGGPLPLPLVHAAPGLQGYLVIPFTDRITKYFLLKSATPMYDGYKRRKTLEAAHRSQIAREKSIEDGAKSHISRKHISFWETINSTVFYKQSY